LTKKKTTTSATERKPDTRSKTQKFQELANKRVPKALKQLKLIGNLSMSGYEYTSEQVEKIRTALQDQLDSSMARFDPKSLSTETFKV
jgi:hypothetical protein